MTTSWSHFMHGQWLQSMTANIGGFLLAIYSVVFAAVCLPVTLSGRIPGYSTQRVMGIGLLAIALISLANWVWRLVS